MSAQDDYNAYQSRQRKAERIHVSRAKGHKGKPKAHKPHKSKQPSRLDDPSQVTRPQTLRDIYRGADTSADLRYGGQERQLGLQTQQVPAWFAAYRAQVAGINQGIQTGYQQAIGDVNTRAQQAQTTDNTGRAQLLAAAQKDAASRGATIDPSLYANDASAGAVRRENQSAFANLLGAQGQAQNTYFGGLQAAGSAAELGQQTRIAQDKQGVASDKGAYKAQYVTDAAQTEHKNRLEDQAFGLDVAKVNQTSADKAAQRRSTSRNQKAQRKATAKNESRTVITSGPFAGLTHAQVRDLTPAQKNQKTASYGKGKGTGASGLTPAQRKAQVEKRNKQTSRIQDVESRWNLYKDQLGKGPDGKVRKPNPGEIKQRLLSEHFSSQEIHLALMWSSPKPWTAKDRRIAKRLGIKLPKKKTPKTKPNTNNVKPTLNPFD